MTRADLLNLIKQLSNPKISIVTKIIITHEEIYELILVSGIKEEALIVISGNAVEGICFYPNGAGYMQMQWLEKKIVEIANANVIHDNKILWFYNGIDENSILHFIGLISNKTPKVIGTISVGYWREIHIRGKTSDIIISLHKGRVNSVLLYNCRLTKQFLQRRKHNLELLLE